MCVLCGVNHNKVPEDEAAQDEIKMNRCWRNAWQKGSQQNRGCNDSRKECLAVTMMEVMASFERIYVGGACVEETIGRVERPYCGCHGDDGDHGQ